MDTLFPFGFPWPTAMYLTLFIVTAAIYMVFMQLRAGRRDRALGRLPRARGAAASRGGPGSPARSGLGLIVKVVRDWLPAILGLAITTGIAPLLVPADPVQAPVLHGQPAVIQPLHAALAGAYRGLLHALPDQEPRTGRAVGSAARAGDDRGFRLLLLRRLGMDGKPCLEPS